MLRTIFAVALLSANVAYADGLGDFGRYTLEFRGEAQVPTGYIFDDTIVGGLSGIDYNRSTESFVAICDDREDPRFYELNIDLTDGWLTDGDVEFTKVTSILDVNGMPFTSAPDPEGIRVAPFPGLLYWTSERIGSNTTPFARVMSLKGHHLSEFNLPEKFVSNPDVTGTRNNLGFESITYGKNRNSLVVANESALIQDGERATLTDPSPARVLRLNTKNGKARQEYIYMVDPIAKAPTPDGAFADSGLVELLTLKNDLMIAMERSFSIGAGYTIKLYLTSTKGATNVSRLASIKDKQIRPMKKKLLLDMDDLGVTLDNIEGMSFGPTINGKRTLILVSDDNFSAFGPQVSQFLAFTIHDRYNWYK